MDLKHIDRDFGRAVHAARESKPGMTQAKLSEALEVYGIYLSEATIGKIERGDRKVTVGEAQAIARALGHTFDGVIGSSEATLRANGTVVASTVRHLQQFADEYATALLHYTRTADELGEDPPADFLHYLETSVPSQTPAQIASDARGKVEAEIERQAIIPGAHLQRLREALNRDADALLAARRDG